MLNTQGIVDVLARSKAGEGERRDLMLPYLGWAFHSTSSRCFSASGNSKEHSFHLGLRFIDRTDFKQFMDYRFPVSSLDFLYHCCSTDRDLPIGFTHLLFLSVGLLFSVLWPRRGLLQMSYGDFSTEHQTKDWCRQPSSMWEPLIWTVCLNWDASTAVHTTDHQWSKIFILFFFTVNCMVYKTKCVHILKHHQSNWKSCVIFWPPNIVIL